MFFKNCVFISNVLIGSRVSIYLLNMESGPKDKGNDPTTLHKSVLLVPNMYTVHVRNIVQDFTYVDTLKPSTPGYHYD